MKLDLDKSQISPNLFRDSFTVTEGIGVSVSTVLTLDMGLLPAWRSVVFKNRGSGLGLAAIAYVGVDYLRHLSPRWHERLQPVLWTFLAIAAVIRVPFYKHWSSELRSALPFIFSLIFMLSALLLEAISVRFVTVVLGSDWHKYVLNFRKFSFLLFLG